MSKRVVIIGAGVIGLCTAYYLSRRGHQVTVIDQCSEDSQGCSYGNAGMVVPSHFIPLAAPGMVALGLKWMFKPESPFYIKPRLNRDLLNWSYRFWKSANQKHVDRAAPLLRDLSLASRECFQELSEQTDNEFGLVKKGLLMLCKTQHGLDEEAEVAKRAEELGIPARVLDATQVREMEPGIRIAVSGAVYFPEDCHLSPQRLMDSLKKQLTGHGVSFHWNTEVTGWKTEQKKIASAETTDGEFSADEFVICGGSWSPSLVRNLKIDIPIQAGKGYSLTLNEPQQLPQICAILTEARVAVTPMGRSLRFGGTMEIAGLNDNINPARVRGIVRAASSYYPDFSEKDFEGVQPWYGLRPCSPDGLPYLGRTRRYSNLSFATGHAMLGVSLGPVSGMILSEILSEEKPSINIDMLSPDRYARKQKNPNPKQLFAL